jgi:hypothetical protein
MGTFPTPLPPTTQHIATVNMILVSIPRICLHSLGDTMPLSPEAEYDAIQSTSPSPNEPTSTGVYFLFTTILVRFPILHFRLHPTYFSIDESIMEMLSIEEAPWDDNHHHSSFLPSLDEIEKDISSIFPTDIIDIPQYLILTQDTIFEGNLGNISQTISVDISTKEGIVENIQLGANFSTEEIETYTDLLKEFCDISPGATKKCPTIDPSIIVHEIKTYPGVKPVRQKLHPIHPKKTAAIKAEVENLLKSGFIYPVPLTEWVSNIILVSKKQGTIHVCFDYRDLNKAHLKDNYPTPFIDQIALEVSFSLLWMDFLDITRSIFYLLINTKHPSSSHGGLSPIGNYLLALKTLEPRFNGLCHMCSMTSNILLNPISMTCQLTQLIDKIILVI